MIKTKDQTEILVDMYDDESHERLVQDFYANKNVNETSETVSVNEKHETDLDATEIDEDYAADSGQWAQFICLFCWQPLFILQNLSKTPNQWSPEV